jgi:hypothetical protein
MTYADTLARYAESAGMTVLDRDWRGVFATLPVVALDGQTLAVVAVTPGGAALPPMAHQSLRQSASVWAEGREHPAGRIRIDHATLAADGTRVCAYRKGGEAPRTVPAAPCSRHWLVVCYAPAGVVLQCQPFDDGTEAVREQQATEQAYAATPFDVEIAVVRGGSAADVKREAYALFHGH